MAQSEQDREDILREATALVERVELWLPDQSEPVVIGFRRDGSPSFFFGTEPVLQFNPQGELRRGYDSGRLLKAVNGQLVSMRRQREQQQVLLISHPLSDQETKEFAQRSLHLLVQLRLVLQTGTVRVGRQFPDGVDVTGRIQDWLERLGQQIVVAKRPNASGRVSHER